MRLICLLCLLIVQALPVWAQMPVTRLVVGNAAAASVVTAQWDANTDGVTTGYQLLYGTVAGGPYPTIIDTGTATSQVVRDLMPGVPYYFVARAYDAAKVFSPFSNQATVTTAAQTTSTTPCAYVAPNSTVMETRPIGTALQGFNPMAGQAQRIGDLRSWGWKVEWQFDPATQRLFLMAWCQGLGTPG
jgi:hypothetical protein